MKINDFKIELKLIKNKLEDSSFLCGSVLTLLLSCYDHEVMTCLDPSEVARHQK